jgi:hypothetical protein
MASGETCSVMSDIYIYIYIYISPIYIYNNLVVDRIDLVRG